MGGFLGGSSGKYFFVLKNAAQALICANNTIVLPAQFYISLYFSHWVTPLLGMIRFFSTTIDEEDLVKRLKMKRLYPDKRVVDYREKLIHSTQNTSIFQLACTDFLAAQQNGAYHDLDKNQALNQFVYLFDAHMRVLLQQNPDSGQQWAMEYLVYYYSDLFHHPAVRQLLANEADRKSCFHDAMLQLLELARNPGYQLEQKVALRSVFYEIFYRRCVDFLRRSATKKNSPNLAWTGPEATLLEQLSKETQEAVEASAFQIDPAALKASVAELGQTCLQLIQWFYFESCPLEEIGRRVNNTVSYVKTTKWRCIQRLKKMLESKIYDHE